MVSSRWWLLNAIGSANEERNQSSPNSKTRAMVFQRLSTTLSAANTANQALPSMTAMGSAITQARSTLPPRESAATPADSQAMATAAASSAAAPASRPPNHCAGGIG